MQNVRLDPTWKKVLASEFEKPYWKELTAFVREEYTKTKVYPPARDIFRALDLCPFDHVKVVIVGQDPYHGEKQANGLCFAVHEGISLPPSLQNIYKEIKNDLKVTPLASGDLSRWARQGVLLLNSVLTVRAGNPASHSKKGWEEFTDAVISALNKHKTHLVYILWGKYAQTKGIGIDRFENLVLQSAHPSPFSAHMFYGHHQFSQCNKYLEENKIAPIDWR